MSAKTVDVLVLGGGPAALLAAALLGRRGLRGVVVDQGELSDASSVNLYDWTIDDRFSPILARLHDQLGLQDDLRRKAVPVRPGLRILAPGARGELEPGSDPARTLARLLGLGAEAVRGDLRRLDEAGQTLSAFLDRVPTLSPSGFLERRRRQAQIADLSALRVPARDVLEPALVRLLAQLIPFATEIDAPLEPTLGQLARPAELVLRGPRLPDGGRPLREVLSERAERAGFEVRRGAAATLAREDRRFKLELSGQPGITWSRAVIDGSRDLAGLTALARGRRRLARTLAHDRPPRARVRATWTVPAGALPEALGAAALILPRGPDERPMWLEVERLDAGRLRLRAAWPTGAPDADRAVAHLRARLEASFPFFEGAPERVAFEPLRPAPSSALGVAGRPVRTPLRPLFLAGPAVCPGCLGVEGAFLAAREAADAAAHLLGARASFLGRRSASAVGVR